MEKKSTHHIIGSSNHAFRSSILLRGVRACDAKDDDMKYKVVMEGFIVILPSIVTLKLFDSATKLIFYYVGEV